MNSITDIYMVAWLEMEKNTVYTDFEMIDGRRARFYYKVSDDEWKKLDMEFGRSYIAKVRSHHNDLRNLMKRWGGRKLTGVQNEEGSNQGQRDKGRL